MHKLLPNLITNDSASAHIPTACLNLFRVGYDYCTPSDNIPCVALKPQPEWSKGLYPMVVF